MIRCTHTALTILAAALLLGLAACGSSPPSRFYTLASLPKGEIPAATEMAERRGIVAVGPVEIADYLDRPQIVRRGGPTTITLLELDRWAGSLQSDIARVLVDNLAVLLAERGYVVMPWAATARADGRIQVSLTRFEGTGEQTVVLDARWTLYGKEKGEVLAAGKEVIVEPVRSGGADETVEAMSRMLAELSRRLAAEAAERLSQAG
jgi:hypothetical protein